MFRCCLEIRFNTCILSDNFFNRRMCIIFKVFWNLQIFATCPWKVENIELFSPDINIKYSSHRQKMLNSTRIEPQTKHQLNKLEY